MYLYRILEYWNIHTKKPNGINTFQIFSYLFYKNTLEYSNCPTKTHDEVGFRSKLGLLGIERIGMEFSQ